MNLDLFNNNANTNDNFVNKFMKELTETLENFVSKTKSEDTNGNVLTENEVTNNTNILDEYNLYEKKKIYLDNISHNGNALAWITDENSVCISENGDGGPISINEIDLPENAEVGEIYEKIGDEYVFNTELTIALNNITLSN